MQSIIELTDKILSLAIAYPKPCQISVRRFITTRDGMKKMAVLFDSIGFEYSRQLFDRITSAQWRIISDLNRERSTSPNRMSEAKILLEIYTDFLIESMSADSPEFIEDPFAFLKELNNYELSSILGKEDPTQIAFISLHWRPEEMSNLLACLKPSVKGQVVLQILRLERIPEEALEKAAAKFANQIKSRFQGIFDEAEMDIESEEGSESIQSIVADIDLDSEQKMLDYIKSKSTSIKLQFKDLKDI
ncbi:MAG: hypothetical protein ABI041_09325 [Bdellovibrionia bacterium]